MPMLQHPLSPNQTQNDDDSADKRYVVAGHEQQQDDYLGAWGYSSYHTIVGQYQVTGEEYDDRLDTRELELGLGQCLGE